MNLPRDERMPRDHNVKRPRPRDTGKHEANLKCLAAQKQQRALISDAHGDDTM